MEIKAQKGPQTAFLASPADIVVYGGAAGGGKTWGLLIEPLRHVNNPDFGAVIFRRTFPQIRNEGGLWDGATDIYPLLGAVPKDTTLEWSFPGGARIKFAHMQYERNRFDWQGAQIPLIGFDELTHFTEGQFFYMLSRNRSVCGVRPYIRATTNPDAASWVKTFLAPWVDGTYPNPAKSGEIRWFVREDGILRWVEEGTPDAKSVTFIRASVYDNRKLLEKDPGYLANLKALPLVDRLRLLDGDWDIMPEGGRVFNRGWFEIVEVAPAGGVECWFWDLAATEKKLAKDDPDFTAGVKIRKVDGTFYVMDCQAEQIDPAQTDRMLVNVSKQGALAARDTGTTYKVRWEREGGASGKRDSLRIARMLAGLDARGVRPDGDKITRAKALSAQAEAGNVKLVRGSWNEDWLTHMHHQPDWPHDDIMDASSGAFNELVEQYAPSAYAGTV